MSERPAWPGPDARRPSAANAADGRARDPGEILASQLVEADMADADMARRLRAALNGDTWACAGLKLGLRQETVRRVCQSGRPTARFMARLCRAYGVDGHWLLTGQGTVRMAVREAAGLKAVPAGALIDEVALRLRSVLAATDGAGGRVGASAALPPTDASPDAGAGEAGAGEDGDGGANRVGSESAGRGILSALAAAAHGFGEVRVIAGEPAANGAPAGDGASVVARALPRTGTREQAC